MSILAEFDAEAARRVLNAINRGEGIPAPASGHWTDRHTLLTAACCLAATLASAPPSEEPLAREYAEARAEALMSDIFAATGWLMQRAAELAAGTYSDNYEPVARAAIALDGAVPTVLGIEGFKARRADG